jgi:hypothetical protein
MYIEEIRILRDFINECLSKSQQKNYLYNESFYNDPHGYYEELYDNYNNSKDYRDLNPANSLQRIEHKNILITYRFIISKVLIIVITNF